MSSIMLVTHLETTQRNPSTPTKLPPPRPSSRPRPRILFPCHVFHFPVLMIHSVLIPPTYESEQSRRATEKWLSTGTGRRPLHDAKRCSNPPPHGERGAFPPLAPRAIAGRPSGRLSAKSAWSGCWQRWKVCDGRSGRGSRGNEEDVSMAWTHLGQKNCASTARSTHEEALKRRGAFFRRKERALRGAPAQHGLALWYRRRPRERAVCAQPRGGTRGCRGANASTTGRTQRDRRFRRKMRCNPSHHYSTSQNGTDARMKARVAVYHNVL